MNTSLQKWLEENTDWIRAFNIINKQLVIWAIREKTPEKIFPPVGGNVQVLDTNNPDFQFVSQEETIQITPKEEWIRISLQKAKNLGSLNNSIRKGAGNFCGYLGEFVFAETFGYKIVSDYNYNYDVHTAFFEIDVKTKACRNEPDPLYACSVTYPKPNSFGKCEFQDCDIYVFVRIKTKGSLNGWILGYVFRDKFIEKAYFGKEGEKEFIPGIEKIGNSEEYYYKADCLNMLNNQLVKFKRVKYFGQEIFAF